MITLICGEDTVKSREYLVNLERDYQKKGFEIQHVQASELQERVNSVADSLDLFGRKQIFVTEHVNKFITRKKSIGSFAHFLEGLDSNSEIELLVWERLSLRDLKLKKLKAIKEFKPDKNIFQLLDACYPSNLKNFVVLLNTIGTTQNEMFIFVMLVRHLRTILLIKMGLSLGSAAPWQAVKLSSQAKYWSEEKLRGFYDGLYRIDFSLKTGKNPHGVKKSLDILACYFL